MPPNVKFLELTEAKLLRLFEKLSRFPKLFDDRHGLIGTLGPLLARRDAVFLELGDEAGLLYAENVERGGHAFVHIIVFNRRRLHDLDEMLRAITNWAFKTFQLSYITAWLPSFNKAAISLIETRLGWQFHGTIPLAAVYGGQRTDVLVYGIGPDGWQ